MSARHVETAKRGYEAFNGRGVEAILDFLDPQIEWRAWEGFAREPHVAHGHDGVREVLAVYEENVDGLRAEPLEFIEAGDHVVVPFRLHGTAKGSDESVEFNLVHVWTFADDSEVLATRLEVYESREEALEAAGLSTS